MFTLSDKIINFLDIKNGDEIIYPGVGPLTKQDSYETIFNEIAEQIRKKRAVVKVGLSISKEVKVKIDYDRIEVVSAFSYKIKGMLFLPNISRWIPSGMTNEVDAIKHFLSNVKRGGLFLYDINNNIFMNCLNGVCDSTENAICERITSRKFLGNHLLIRKIT